MAKAAKKAEAEAPADNAVATPTADTAPEAATAPPAGDTPEASTDPLDHDGDGRKGGTKAKAKPPAPIKRHTIIALGDFSFPWNGALISFRENKRYPDLDADMLEAMKAAGAPIEER